MTDRDELLRRIGEWGLDDLGRAARVCPNPLRRKAVDELVRRSKVADAVLERVNGRGFVEVGTSERPGEMCPSCGRSGLVDGGHDDDCPLTRYLEATDG